MSISRIIARNAPRIKGHRSMSTMDTESVAHFTRLSSQWWDPQGEFALLHAMNPVRLQFMREKLREVGEWEQTRASVENNRSISNQQPWLQGGAWLAGQRTLDVGCGGGLLSESLARLGANVTGIDASSSNIEMAKIHASQDDKLSQHASLDYQSIMAEDLLAKAGKEQFDIVCAMEVVEHVRQPDLFLRTLADLLKPGGHLFMSTIARTPLSYFLTIFMAENVMRFVTPGTHKHSQYIDPDELVDHFRTQTPWIAQDETAMSPKRLQYETRGTFYVPGLGKWVLAPRESNKTITEAANYFFWIRKPF